MQRRECRTGWDRRGFPSPCGLRARGRAPLQACDVHGSGTVLQLPGQSLEMRLASAAEARQRRFQGTVGSASDICRAPRRPAGSALEAERLSRRVMCMVPSPCCRNGSGWHDSQRPLSEQSLEMRQASAAEAHQRRFWGTVESASDICPAPRRPAGSALEAERLSRRVMCMVPSPRVWAGLTCFAALPSPRQAEEGVGRTAMHALEHA
jgi:hypothetical protein